MWVHISGRQVGDFETLTTRSGTSWGWWCSGKRWCQLWSLLSVWVRRRYTCSVASPVCLRISCNAKWARKASRCVAMMKHSRVSFYCSFHRFMARKLNTTFLLFSDLRVRFLDWILYFLYCSPPKPSFGHSCHVQGQAHVGLFQLYMTSLPCHRSSHVEYLPQISCCFKQWDTVDSSPIYASIDSSKVIQTRFRHSRGCFSGNSCVEIQVLTTPWCLISQTVQTNALVHHGGFPLRAAINWSPSSQCTPAVW